MNKKGFTLIELLAVIAIIGILSIIAVPNIIKLFQNSKKTLFENELKNIFNIANSEYQMDSDDLYSSNILYANGTDESDTRTLSISGSSVNYSISFDNEGNIACFKATNDEFFYDKPLGINDASDIETKDIVILNEENSLNDEFNITKNNCSSNLTILGSHIQSTTDKLSSTKFKNFVETNSPTEIYFVITGRDSGTDISTNTSDTEAIYAWMDGTKMYISASDENKKITLPSDSSYLFGDVSTPSKLRNISKIDVTYLNTSNVTDMLGMFANAGYNITDNFEIVGLKYWNTSKVVTMANMFYHAGESATTFNLNLNKWDTSKVTDMFQMFCGTGESATTWNIGNLSNWNTSNVTDMYAMFYHAGESATTWNIGDLSNWNTSQVTNMSYMFNRAGKSATTFNLNLSKWDTSKVTNMSYMFYYAGNNTSTFSLIIPRENGNGTSNTNTTMYGSTSSVSASSPNTTNHIFTLATN